MNPKCLVVQERLLQEQMQTSCLPTSTKPFRSLESVSDEHQRVLDKQSGHVRFDDQQLPVFEEESKGVTIQQVTTKHVGRNLFLIVLSKTTLTTVVEDPTCAITPLELTFRALLILFSS